MTAAFNPANVDTWIARGRAPDLAALIADAWRRFPDLAPDAPLDLRKARSRARVAAMRPVMEAVRIATDQARQSANFAFTERRFAAGEGDERDRAILRGRDRHGLDWDAAVQFAHGWYAARAGWEARPPRERSDETRTAAYMTGFRAGGGDPDDLFDAARRSLLVAPDAPNEPLRATVRGRPLPSSWPQPGDAGLPARSSRRLLILGAPETGMMVGDHGTSELSAELLTLVRADPASDECLIMTVSGTGFTILPAAGSPLVPLDTAEAARLSTDPGTADSLRALMGAREFDDILVAAQGLYLALVDAHHAALPLCRSMERTRNSLLLQRAQMRTWLARTMAAGESRGAGHIRWGKAIKGLVGRLGEFTARYTGKVAGKGHRIIVETGDREPATGFSTSSGEPLAWESFISNRAHLRAAMTDRLRAFGGATRLTHARNS